MFAVQGKLRCATVTVAVFVLSASSRGATGDTDTTGYVDLQDYRFFGSCFVFGGPLASIPEACLEWFDGDADQNLDLADFATLQRNFGHLPIPMRDAAGALVGVGSTTPYSARHTCGTTGCHDLDTLDGGITNGFHFQQGRTDVQGNVVMKDDYFGDGRWWMRSPGRFGIWSQATTLQMAGKTNVNESAFDQSAFAWIRDCAGCHPGAGVSEFDRDGLPYYDAVSGQFGYELLGKSAAEVTLDGDYADFDYATSQVVPAPWDKTGVAGPDCLYCHRAGRPLEATPYGTVDLVKHWRESTLGAGENLVDASGEHVPAFASAATASQGWFSGDLNVVQDGFVPRATTLQIDYGVGLTDGSLMECESGAACINPEAIAAQPPDRACWACHVQKELLNGMVWFDGTPDVHYRYLNNLSDEDPNNDISGDNSHACVYCHPSGLDHNVAKGNDFRFASRDELDYVGLRSCRDCHLDGSPLAHPDAPPVPTYAFDDIHIFPMFDTLSCQACHVPYALGMALVYFDPTLASGVWPEMCCASVTAQYYSADPLDPTNPDKSRWYPALASKTDSDGVDRLFPYIPWVNFHWADWDQNGTPEDLSDDILTPIIQWRIHQVIDDQILSLVTDDDNDGRPEVNRPAEILPYIAALKGFDNYGRQLAQRPVLVRGPWVWYEDPASAEGVSVFAHAGTGMPVDWAYYAYGLDHNVLPIEEAWGYGEDPVGCDDCHAPDGMSPVFDRKILVDPYGPSGQPFYQTVTQMTGVDAPS